MTNIYDIDQTDLIEEVAKELKKIPEIKQPEWAICVKTGANKARPPLRNDWWYVRVASVLRYVFKKGPIGVEKLRVKYGGRKDRGMKPERFIKGSGSILRKSLQQLEKAGLVKKADKGFHKGRIITPQGVKLLDKCARDLLKVRPKETVQKKVEQEIPKTQKNKKQEIVNIPTKNE